MLLLGESANQLYNRPGNNEVGNRYAQFLDVAKSLRNLQRNNQLIVGLEPGEHEGESALVLILTPEAANSASYLLVCKAIGIECDGQPIRLRPAFGAPADGKTLALATRSLFSVIYHLSRHVDAPQMDIDAGIASPAPESYAESSGGTSALSRLFRVRSSEHEPEIASVKVFYRDTWFYIADTDQDSKTTFALLSMLITLQSGDTIGVTSLISLATG